ncbi:MAG: hypothetical protein ACI90V_005193, partial [Bacillariaceae sp.]|jgi:hypothetical protein
VWTRRWRIRTSRVCAGDTLVIPPVPIFIDQSFTSSPVGFWTVTDTFLDPVAKGLLESSGTIFFNDGSEVQSAGILTTPKIISESDSGDLAIVGGIKRYQGASGDLEFVVEPGTEGNDMVKLCFV